MEYRTQREKDKDTFGIVSRAVQYKGIEAVRKIVYGENENAEITALANFVNSRMFKIDLQNKLME